MPPRPNPGTIGIRHPACLRAWVSRLLLLLATVVLVANPVTQNLWTWDRFLHGGHDFETNVLLILVALCLVLVLAQRRPRNAAIFAILLWRSVSRPDPPTGRPAPIRLACVDRGAGPPERVCNLPLLI